MRKGDLVAKVLHGAGFSTASIAEIESIKGGIIKVVDSGLEWDEDSLREINPAIPGFSTTLIPLDGGEEERIRRGIGPKRKAKP